MWSHNIWFFLLSVTSSVGFCVIIVIFCISAWTYRIFKQLSWWEMFSISTYVDFWKLIFLITSLEARFSGLIWVISSACMAWLWTADQNHGGTPQVCVAMNELLSWVCLHNGPAWIFFSTSWSEKWIVWTLSLVILIVHGQTLLIYTVSEMVIWVPTVGIFSGYIQVTIQHYWSSYGNFYRSDMDNDQLSVCRRLM